MYLSHLDATLLGISSDQDRSETSRGSDGGHREGPVPHVEPDRGAACGRGPCTVQADRVVAVPLARGGVTFHHGLMPHMTRSNRSNRWRQVLIQRFFVGRPPGSGEPD